MRNVRTVVNRREVERLKQHPDVQDKVGENAYAIADLAEIYAPKDSGEGAESIHAEQQSDGTWRVSWDDEHYYMLFPEIGTEKQSAQPFLRPAADRFR